MIYRWRFWFIVCLLSLAALGLVYRMIDLMVLDRAFLQDQGDMRSLRVLQIPAYRGMILDRNGVPLAISTPVDSVWIDPRIFNPNPEELSKLASILHQSPATIKETDSKHSKRGFVYLDRGLVPYIGQRIKDLKIPGVYLQREFRRYYPDGETTAQLIGFTNIDDQGQEGLELEYNKWLAGSPGKERVLKDRLGRVVAKIDLLKAPKPGHNLILSIDRRIQYVAYRDLKETIHKYHAKSGSVVVLSVATGEVLAMANQPSFNPNNRPKVMTGRFRNRAVTDVFEPGSTIKAFSVVNALSSGLFKPETEINTAPGWMMVNGKEVRDDLNYGTLTVTGVLQKSSNIGVTKMTLATAPDSLYQLLRRIGFGHGTDSHFPGESSGVLINHRDWHPFTLATMSFGYGLSVTNLQLAHAYETLADGGIEHPISLLKTDEKVPGKRIIKAKIAYEVLNMLQAVVANGTATRAKVAGYNVSGKTGTVRMIGPNGYEKNHHTALFVGEAPASDPKIVVSVVVKDPQGKYYGGLVAAPLFARVMGSALRILDIPPDNVAQNKKVA